MHPVNFSLICAIATCDLEKINFIYESPQMLFLQTSFSICL